MGQGGGMDGGEGYAVGGGRSGFRPDPLASFSLFCSLLCLSTPLIPLASVLRSLCISWFELELALGVQLRA